MCLMKELLLHLLISFLLPFLPNFLHAPVNAASLKSLPLSVAGLKQGGCQSPFLSQQHVHCLNLATVTHPVFPSLGDKRPPHQRGGMTLLSGMLEIPNLPTSVCEFKSPLLEAGLGLQLMTPRDRGSVHWWAEVLRHCASQVVHFSHNCSLLSFSSPPSHILYYGSILCKNDPGIIMAIIKHFSFLYVC